MLSARPVRPDEYRALYNHMKRDFPSNERPPYFAVKNNLKRGVYTALYLTDGDVPVGYAVATAPEGIPYALINFLAVLPENRERGLGGAFLKILTERFSGRALVLEVESPAASENEAQRTLRERRIGFYTRGGFRFVPTSRARIFGVDMEIMVNTPEDTGSVRALLHALYRPAFPSDLWLRNIDVRDPE